MSKQTWLSATGLITILGTASLLAQDFEEVNFVREFVSFRVVEVFGSNPNNVDIFPDYCIDFKEDPEAQGECGATSPYGIAYEDFLDRLSSAYAEGLGGVINFENPIQGPILQAPDRTGYRAVVEQYQEDNPVEGFEDAIRDEFPEMGDRDVLIEAIRRQIAAGLEIAEEEFEDPESAPVFARVDRGLNDEVDNPFSSRLFTKDLVALYGEDFQTQLRISKGPMMWTEGMLASRLQPGAESIETWFNAEDFPEIGASGYSGGAYQPVSGINTLNNGMVDLQFDARDNVKAIGFSFHTYGNFQYYQGEGGVPQNPNNMLVTVYFSDGTQEELAETSRQSSGNWDVFFGVEAPEGESITGLWCRVIGNNFRTIVSIDDLSFITEPDVPYIVGQTTFRGAEGAEFYASLDIGQKLEAITFNGLPEGIGYNAETGLLEGRFEDAGNFVTEVILENEVGTNTVELNFEVEEPLEAGEELDILPVDPANVVLRRDLVPVEVSTTADEQALAGDIEFFTRTFRLLEDGSRRLTSLDQLGLQQVDNVIMGNPSAAQQVGEFEVEMYARYDLSSAKEVIRLNILAPTVSPNFDANGTTDLAVRRGNEIYTVSAPETGEGFGVGPLSRKLGSLSAGSDVYAVDVNGDIGVDFVEWDAEGGQVVQYVNDGESGFAETVLLEGIDSSESGSVVDAADYNGDGNADLLWVDPSDKAYSIWLLGGGSILWAGLTEMERASDTFVGSADFTGSGQEALLWRTEAGDYRIENLTAFENLGTIERESVSFRLDGAWEILQLVDMTADGIVDILWENAETGEVMLWRMDGLELSEDLVEPMEGEEEVEVWTGRVGELLLPAGFNWSVIICADFNNDQYGDLLLRNRRSDELGLLRMRGSEALGEILRIGERGDVVLAHGDYNGDSVNDLLIGTADGGHALVTVGEDGSVSRTSYSAGLAVSDGEWMTPVAYRNEAMADDGALSWLGRYEFVDNRWIHAERWGWLYWMSDQSATGTYFLDPVLGIIWMSGETFPRFFQERNQFWLRYEEGTENPRMFFNYVFEFPMSEGDL